jgi:hypothetical protein
MFNRPVVAFAFFSFFLGIAHPQSTPITCVTTAGNPVVRAEGITEPLGDIFLNCTGGALGTTLMPPMFRSPSIAAPDRLSRTGRGASDYR